MNILLDAQQHAKICDFGLAHQMCIERRDALKDVESRGGPPTSRGSWMARVAVQGIWRQSATTLAWASSRRGGQLLCARNTLLRSHRYLGSCGFGLLRRSGTGFDVVGKASFLCV